MLTLEELDERTLPSVQFVFHSDDPFFSPAVLRTLEAAGRAMSDFPHANGREGRIDVALTAKPLESPRLAQAAPDFIDFDPRVKWHFGVSETGLDADEYDFFTLACHELGHVLGEPHSDGVMRPSFDRGVRVLPPSGEPVRYALLGDLFLTIRDYDFDGNPDVRVQTLGTGFDVTVSAAGVPLDPPVIKVSPWPFFS